jgi:nucleotide-binding universal stress UspA family protein
MDSLQRNIIVPWDFAPSSNYALEHAIKIAKIRNYNISLLHIVEHGKEEASVHAKLKELAATTQERTGISINLLIQSGDVLTSISELASLPDTELVIMKTDGIKGIQKYTGSRAIKIMRGSKAPFIVVQEPPTDELFHSIVYPIDYRPENKEVISILLNLSKFYNAKIHIFKARSTDVSFKKTIANNLNFAKMMLESKQLPFEICEAPGVVDYATEVNEYANQIKADIIIIQLQRNLTLSKFLFGVKEQNIIANPYKIPVMCLNPREVKVYAGFR